MIEVAPELALLGMFLLGVLATSGEGRSRVGGYQPTRSSDQPAGPPGHVTVVHDPSEVSGKEPSRDDE